MSIPFITLAILNPESGLVVVLILVLMFGAKKLPELARGLAQSINEFKKGKDEQLNDKTPEQPPQPPRQIP